MALGVQANARTQCEWVCVAVEYRLKANLVPFFVFVGGWGIAIENIHTSLKPDSYNYDISILLSVLMDTSDIVLKSSISPC